MDENNGLPQVPEPPQSPQEALGIAHRSCPACMAQIAGEARSCPLCGHVVAAARKVWIGLSAALLVVIGLAARIGVGYFLRTISVRANSVMVLPATPQALSLQRRVVLMANHAAAATQVLGTPIVTAGNSTVKAGHLIIPIKGPEGDGTLDAKIWGTGEGFTISSLDLVRGGQQNIDLWPRHISASSGDLHGTGTVFLVPVGKQRVDLNGMVAHYQSRFGLTVKVLPAVAPPPAAFNHRRNQWSAEQLLAAMKDAAPESGSEDAYLIGVTDDDIYSESNSWAFTYSWRAPHQAVISTARMDEDFWNSEDLLWRVHAMLLRSFKPQTWAQHRTEQDRLVERSAEQMITKDIAVLYWHIPLNDDPQSVMLSLLTPDGGADDVWQSDVRPAESLMGMDTGCPQLRLSFDRAGNVALDQGGLPTDCNTLEPPRLGEHSVIVHLASGMVEAETVDFRQPGPIPIEFGRMYASYWAGKPTVMGPGWSHSYALNLGSDCPGSDACVSLAGMGWSYRFSKMQPAQNSNGAPRWQGLSPGSVYYRSALTLDGAGLKLVQQNGDVSSFFNCTDIEHPCSWNGFRRHDGSKLVFQNNAFHDLTSLASGSSSFDLAYDSARHVNAAVLNTGEQYQYEHDDHGCLSSARYSDGSAVLYQYTGSDCLLSTIAVQPAGGEGIRLVLKLEWDGKRATAVELGDGRRFTIDYQGGAVYAKSFDLTTPAGTRYHFESQADKDYIGWVQ